MIATSGQRPLGWEAGRTPWNVEFHLWCDELSDRLAELARRSTRARTVAYARSCGLSVTVDSGGVPVDAEHAELHAQGSLLEWGVAAQSGFVLDQTLCSRIVWAARATAKEAAERKAKASSALTGTDSRILAPQPGRGPGGVWDCALNAEDRIRFGELLIAMASGASDDAARAELAEYLDGGSAITTMFFGLGDKADEAAPQAGGVTGLRVSSDTSLLVSDVVLADQPEWGRRFAWLLRHAGLAMRAWHNEQVAELMADAPQLTDYFDGPVLCEPLTLPAVPDWPDDGDEAREAFLASVETRFWFEEPKMESLAEARREGGRP
jgi:hypothetical protein